MLNAERLALAKLEDHIHRKGARSPDAQLESYVASQYARLTNIPSGCP
jgi:hypothetical protein